MLVLSRKPCIIGKVFENLLPENIKKKQGTFYTPREVVNYICESNLIDYLLSHQCFD